MPYFFKQPPEPLTLDTGAIVCTHDDPDDCPCTEPDPWPLRFKFWRKRMAWKTDRLFRQLAFWQFPARIERLSIRCAMLESQVGLLGQSLGAVVEEKNKVKYAAQDAAYLSTDNPKAGRRGWVEVDQRVLPEEPDEAVEEQA